MKKTRLREKTARVTAGITVGAALMLSSCHHANFKAADTDKSGTVSEAEFERYMLEAIYAEADANGDSKVVFDEWVKVNPDAEKAKFKAPDRNRDGAVTPDELKRHYARYGTMKDLFKKIDTNKDGQLTQEEVAAFKKKMDAQSGSTEIQRLSQAAR